MMFETNCSEADIEYDHLNYGAWLTLHQGQKNIVASIKIDADIL